MGRVLFIGDVHGCHSELVKLLAKLRYQPGADKLIFVGDLVNKGPASREVLELAREHNAQVVLGNHDGRILKHPKESNVSDELLQWMESWPLYIETEDYLAVHAGLQPGKHPRDTNPDILLTIRTWDGEGKDLKSEKNPAWYELYKGKKTVVFGHWAKRGLVDRPNAVGLDTGCVYGRELTALVWPERRFVQVKADRAYVKISN